MPAPPDPLTDRDDPRVAQLLELHRAMTSTLELDELLGRIAAAVTEIVPCEWCILWLWDADAGVLRPATMRGIDPAELGDHAFRPGEGVIGAAFASLDTVISEDLRRDPRFVAKGTAADRIASLIDVPLLLEELPIGVLDAANKVPGRVFDGDDARLLEMLAAQAAVAIRNARDHREIRRRVRELEALHGITEVIGTSLEPAEVLDKIVRAVARLMEARDCAIYLLEPREESLVLAAALGPREGQVGAHRLGWNQALARRGVLAAPMAVSAKRVGVLEVRLGRDQEPTREDRMLFDTVARQTAVFVEKSQLYRTVQDIYLKVIKALSEAVEAKDPETVGHCFRVSHYAERIAERMGLGDVEVERIRIASYLHDIGKIGVPEAILLKPGRLTGAEYEQIKEHTDIGAKILGPLEHFQPVSTIVRHHHERWDGSGYPDGLAGDAIPLGARILAVADTFEAMTWNRPYHEGQRPEQALEELARCAGSQFDPEVVEAFRAVYGELRLPGLGPAPGRRTKTVT